MERQVADDEWVDTMLTHLNIIKKIESIHNPYYIRCGGVYNYEGTFGVDITDGISPIVSNNEKMYSVDIILSIQNVKYVGRSYVFSSHKQAVSYKHYKFQEITFTY